MNEINIKPYESVGNFHFGKTQKEIITQFGDLIAKSFFF